MRRGVTVCSALAITLALSWGYPTMSLAQPACGDGVVEAPERCDPPGGCCNDDCTCGVGEPCGELCSATLKCVDFPEFGFPCQCILEGECGAAEFPTCLGTCPPNQVCLGILGDSCRCYSKEDACFFGEPGSCGGLCPPGYDCVDTGTACKCR